jgi:hypothetical protein
MNAPETSGLTMTDSAPRGRFWSSSFRWGFGVLAPILCFSLDLYWTVPRSAALAFVAVCVVVQAWTLLCPPRGSWSAGFFGGLLVAGSVFAGGHSAVMLMAFLPVGAMLLLSACAYFQSGIEALRQWTASNLLAGGLSLLCGLALPFGAAVLSYYIAGAA